MYFDPTRGASDILPMVLRPPAFHKAHAYCTHLGELIDCLKAMVDTLAQQLSKLLVVEDLQTTARRDLTDGGWVETVVEVTGSTLHKNTAVTETLREDFSSNIVQVNSFANMPAGVFYGGVTVDIR